MKIITVVGARPQFIKAAALSREIKKHNNINEIIVHTGQHFDKNMSDIFFEEMMIPKPLYNLNINGLNHGAMTGQMLEGIEKILLKEKPDWVLVYGDTNSTLAGALAAKKLHIKVAHVEAGLRSFNMKMPEEVNRILTDRISDLLFCPTKNAMYNLEMEGYNNSNSKFINSGDIMYDSVLFYSKYAKKPRFSLPDEYILTTIHRAENTDNLNNLNNIFKALSEIAKDITIVLPIHPRTKGILAKNKLKIHENIKLIEPVGYLEMIYLLNNCSCVMTDSGGLQKEAFFFKKPCITLREETEWTELVENGYNFITGANKQLIVNSYNLLDDKNLTFNKQFYGNGNTSEIILKALINS